jgi:uncharacterized Zn-binding protein involved in type VI secretion
MILGWIRFGDKAACGGTVCEGIPNNIRMGQPLAFVGAKIACKHGCIIATGLPNYRDNGRSIPHHMHTSSRGCPIYSTLNGVDGWEDGSDSAPAERCFKNADGEWAEVKEPSAHEDPFDEQPLLSAQAPEGTPYLIETMDGRKFSGTIGADGQLPRIDTFGEDEYAIYWGEEAINKAGGAA